MKTLPMLLKSFCAAAFITLAAANAPAQIVTNGGFETGDFTGWTVVDPSGFTNVGGDPAFAREGTFHANLGATPDTGSLSQLLATTPGQSYTLNFSLAIDSTLTGGFSNFFQALFNGIPVLTLTDQPPSGYTDYSFGGLIATSASTSLEFRYRHDDDFFRLDAISVVPELASTAWLALPTFAGLLLLHARVRRSRKASV